MHELISKTVKKLNSLGKYYEGCSEAEVDAIMKSQNVKSLPPIYLDFLKTMGKGASGLFVGTDVYFQYLPNLKEGAIQLLAEDESKFKLPENAFVFLMHQGYQFMYFLSGNSDDPEVFHYMELEGQPTTKYKSLSEFFEKNIDII